MLAWRAMRKTIAESGCTLAIFDRQTMQRREQCGLHNRGVAPLLLRNVARLGDDPEPFVVAAALQRIHLLRGSGENGVMMRPIVSDAGLDSILRPQRHIQGRECGDS